MELTEDKYNYIKEYYLRRHKKMVIASYIFIIYSVIPLLYVLWHFLTTNETFFLNNVMSRFFFAFIWFFGFLFMEHKVRQTSDYKGIYNIMNGNFKVTEEKVIWDNEFSELGHPILEVKNGMKNIKSTKKQVQLTNNNQMIFVSNGTGKNLLDKLITVIDIPNVKTSLHGFYFD